MHLTIKSLIFFLLLALTSAKAQDSSDTLLAKDNVMIPLPTVSINFGFNHLMADVKLKDGPSPFQQFGYQLSITQRVTKFLNATLDLYTGTVYGEEQRNLTNINFRTTLFSQHLNLEYNFYPLLKPDANGRQLIRPYIGVGVGAIFFRSKGDLKDESGNEYNYWSDGLIYAEAEGTVNQSEATPLTRDFEYETDLRDANLDGLRKYSQTAFSLPLNAGIRFQITKNIGVNAAFAYAFNFSDMLDNVSESGTGDRLGSAGNDNHLYGSIGLSVFLGRTKPSSKPKKTEPEILADLNTLETPISESESSVLHPNKTEPETKNSTQALSIANVSEAFNEVEATSLKTSRELEQTLQHSKEVAATKEKLESFKSAVGDLKSSFSETEKKITKSAKETLLKAVDNQTQLLTNLRESSIIYESESSLIAENANRSSGKLETELEKVESIKVDIKKAKTEKQGLELISTIEGVANASIDLAENKQLELTEATQIKRLTNFEDKLSLYEFVKDSDGLTEEESTQLINLRALLKSELDELVEAGVVDAAKQLVFENSLVPLQLPIDKEITSLDQPSSGDSSTDSTQELNNQKSATTISSESEESSLKTSDSETQSANTPEVESNKRKTPTTAEIENTPPKLSGGFHWADVNENGWISPDEVLHFIDLLFEGESVRTVEDIQNLIDYYFDQE